MKIFYRGFYLSSMSTATDAGGFQARVAIMALDSSRTRFQRFLDLEICGTKDEADERAIAAGQEWVDSSSAAGR